MGSHSWQHSLRWQQPLPQLCIMEGASSRPLMSSVGAVPLLIPWEYRGRPPSGFCSTHHSPLGHSAASLSVHPTPAS